MRLGLFTPQGEETYFEDKELDFTGTADDLEDVVGGIDFIHRFNGRVGFMVSADYFEGSNQQSYLFYEDNFGDDISHVTTLEIMPLTVGVIFPLAPERSPVVPYVGAGGGAYVWRLEESGDFIDFDTVNDIVFTDTFEDDGTALGWYAVAGIDIRLSPYFSFFAEGRWDDASDDLEGDFAGFGKIDLSGERFMGGVSWSF